VRKDATNAKLREAQDRPVLLLITRPREGWEQEVQEITCLEIDRPALRDDGRGTMGSSPRTRVVYTPHPGVTAETEAAALARVYRYILRCHEEKAAEAVGAPEEAGGGGHHESELNDASS
jgi:hypothetical protein